MKNKIIKAEDLPINEVVYLRKNVLGWSVVHPIRNEDRTFNKKNLWLGSRKVIILTIVWILIMGFIFYGVNEMVKSCRDMAKNPCNYFKIDCSNVKSNSYNLIQGGEKDEP